jgi:hypothetical protein
MSISPASPDRLIRIFPEPEINVVVVGGEANPYWRIMGAAARGQCSGARLCAGHTDSWPAQTIDAVGQLG